MIKTIPSKGLYTEVNNKHQETRLWLIIAPLISPNKKSTIRSISIYYKKSGTSLIWKSKLQGIWATKDNSTHN